MMKCKPNGNLSVNLDNLLECWRLEVSNKKRPGRRISLLFNVLRRARKDNKLRFLFAFRLAQYFDARGGLARRHARRMQQRSSARTARSASRPWAWQRMRCALVTT